MSFKTTRKLTMLDPMRAASKIARAHFGSQLKAWRAKHDYTQQDLATEIPCSLSIVSKWEAGLTTPGSKLLRKRIKDVTGIDVDEIIRDIDLNGGGERD